MERHNEIFHTGFRSDLHAEMVLMNAFESQQPGKADLSRYTLVSSLEPCPMCMTRLILAGIGRVLYVCPDNDGGMVQHRHALPPVFRQFMRDQEQEWELASCSEELRNAAYDIWDTSRSNLDQLISPGES